MSVAVISLLPTAFGELGLVGRDTWFFSRTVATFACTARALAPEARRPTRWSIGAVVLAWLTTASRQNGASVVFLALGLLACPLWLVRRFAGRRRPRLWTAAGATVIGLVASLVMMGSHGALDRALSVKHTNTSASLFLYDLAMLSQRAGHNYFPASALSDRTMKTIDERSSIVGIDAMIDPPHQPIQWPISKPVAAALTKAWEHRIEADPMATCGCVWECSSTRPVSPPTPLGLPPVYRPEPVRVLDVIHVGQQHCQRLGAAVHRTREQGRRAVHGVALSARLRVDRRGHDPPPGAPRGVHRRVRAVSVNYASACRSRRGVDYRYSFPSLVIAELEVVMTARVAWRAHRADQRRDKKRLVSASASGVPIS